MALLFARCVQEQVRRRQWVESRVPSTERMDELSGVLPEDQLAAYSFAKQVYQTAPLQSALDHVIEDKAAAEEIAWRFSALPKERRVAFADLPMNMMAHDLVLPLADLHLVRKNLDLALLFGNCGILRRPWSPEAHLVRAKVLDRSGDLEAAKNALKVALELRPGWPPAADYLAALPP